MDFKKSNLGAAETVKYYGIGLFKPEIINPTKEELSIFLGKTLTNDLNYINTKNIDNRDVKQLRLDIWGEIPEYDSRPAIKTKITFFLEGRFDISSKGSTKYINGQGIASYLPEGKTLDYLNLKKVWFHTESARKAIVGEDLVIKFLTKLWNVENRLDKFTMKDEDVPNFFLNTEELFKGNWSSIQTLFNELNTNTIKCYFGIRSREVEDKTYYDMEIYNKEFQYSNAKSNEPIINALNSEYTAFKHNVAPISDTLEPFDYSAFSANKKAEDSLKSKVNDDLPF